jgi:hypothetical protein
MDYREDAAGLEIDDLLAQLEELKEKMKDELYGLSVPVEDAEEDYLAVPSDALNDLLQWPFSCSQRWVEVVTPTDTRLVPEVVLN